MTTTSAATPPHETTSVVVKTAGPDGCPSCQAEGQAVTTWRITTRRRATTLANIQEAEVQCASCYQTNTITRKQPNTLGKIMILTRDALATAIGLTVGNNAQEEEHNPARKSVSLPRRSATPA